MKNFLKKNWSWIIVIICLLGFSIIVFNLKNNNLAAFDTAVYNLVTISKNDILTKFYSIMTYFCEPITIIILFILLLIFMKDKLKFFNLALASFSTTVLNYVVKKIIKRPRPTGIALVKETGYSFPSNHAMVCISFYGFILYLILKSDSSKLIKILSTILIILIITLVSISRIYLGVHNASDVLAGLLLSASFTISYINLIYKKRVLK